MIFWVFLGITIIGFTIYLVCDSVWAGAISILTLIATLIMSIAIGITYINADAHLKECQEYQRILSYQLENNLYDNDNDYGKRELYVAVESWNTQLTYKKEMQDNFWVGIFIPNIYNDLDLIELR